MLSAEVTIETQEGVPIPMATPADKTPTGNTRPPESIVLVRGYMDTHASTLMADSGASHNFASPRFVHSLGLTTTASPLTAVRMGDGKTVTAPGQQVQVKELHLAGSRDSGGRTPLVTFRNITFHLVPLAPYCDAVLGMEFFKHAKLQLDYHTTDSGHTTCSGIRVTPPGVQSTKAIRELHPGEFFCLSEDTSAVLNSLLSKHATLANSRTGQEALDRESQKISQMIMTEFKSVFADPDGSQPLIRDFEGSEHHINFEKDKPLPKPRPFIRLSQEKEEELQKQIKEMIKQGHIRPSQSRFASATFLVPKADGGWRMVVDYRAINNITEKDSYPLPLAEDLFNRMKDATVFSKIDLKSGFYQIPLARKDWSKTAFRTPSGLYEYTVVPMGLCNAPATFMRMMNNIFRTMIDENFVVVFMDDIVIYSKSVAEHAVHLRRVLNELKKQRLYAKASKCTFFTRAVQFLGHILTPEGVHPMPEKREAIKAWPVPKDKEQLRSFLGLCNYYSKFIDKYSHIAAPLTALTGATQPWEWDPLVHTAAFEQLKTALDSAPCLIHPRSDLPFVLGTDASDFAIGAVLMQDHGKGLQPIGYYGRKLNKAERNYAVYDKEMLAVVYALNNWHYLLESSKYPVKVMTDHQPLSHFATAPVKPNLRSHGRWQRWLEQLGMFKLDWNYVKGTTQWADPISRRPDFVNLEGDSSDGGGTPAATLSMIQMASDPDYTLITDVPETVGIIPWLYHSASFSAVHAIHASATDKKKSLADYTIRPPPLSHCDACQALRQEMSLIHRQLAHLPKRGCEPSSMDNLTASFNQLVATDNQLNTCIAQLAAVHLTTRQQLLAEEGKEQRRAITLQRYRESHEGRVPGAPPPDTFGNIVMPTRRCAAMVTRWSDAPRTSKWQPRQRVLDQCRQLTRYGAYCWTHLAKEERLRVKTSSIPGAGRGVFATRHIRPGEVIGQYTGDLLRGDYSSRSDPNTGGVYYLQLNNHLCVDAARTDTHVSRFINDPRGTGQRPNCKFAHDGRTSIVRVRATRHIQPGQELLLSYGRTYWDAYNHLLQWTSHHPWSPTPGTTRHRSSDTIVTQATHPHVTTPASQYVLDTLAETALGELAAIDTAIYCAITIDLHTAGMAKHRRKRKGQSNLGTSSMSAITTRRRNPRAGPASQPQTHSSTQATPVPSVNGASPSTNPVTANRQTAAVSTDEQGPTPPASSNDPRSPSDQGPHSADSSTPATTDSDPANDQSPSSSYIDKWVSQTNTQQFVNLVRAAATADHEYQAMIIAVKLSTSTGEGKPDISSATPDALGPFVEGRLITLAVKYKERLKLHAKLGFHYTVRDDGLLYLSSNANRRLVIPRDTKVRTLLLAYLHDHDGHHGRDKVISSMQLRVWWQGMDADIRRYIASCPRCQQVRAPPGKEQGMAMPLEAPQYPWQWVTMDFLGPLPVASHTLDTTLEPSSSRKKKSAKESVDQRAPGNSTGKSLRGHDMILVFVDRFSKMKHFVACKSTITAQQTVQLFEQNVVRLHGWPEYLTTDRGAVFTSKYWQNYFHRVGVKLRMTTAYHPQTDGQSEREIKTLQKVLSSYVNARRDDWDLHLPMVEFAINSTPSVATGRSPFKVLYGVEANKPIDIALGHLLKHSENRCADGTVLGHSTSTVEGPGVLEHSECDLSHISRHPSTSPSGPSIDRAKYPESTRRNRNHQPNHTNRARHGTPGLASGTRMDHMHIYTHCPSSSKHPSPSLAYPSVPRAATRGTPTPGLVPTLSFPADVDNHDCKPHRPKSPIDTDFVVVRQAVLQAMGPTDVDDSNPAVDARLAELQRIVLETRLALTRYQETMAAAIAKHRRAVNYTVGEQVMLSTHHLVLPTDSATTSSKLRPNYVGPYTISRVISPNVVELQLNREDRFHPRVNVCRLKPFQATPPSFADRPQPILRPPPAVSGEGQEAEWTVESIVGHRFNRRKKRYEYCVKWLGYDDSEASWEPISHIYNNQYFLEYIIKEPAPTVVHDEIRRLRQLADAQSSQ